jgi:hypothetical protein
MDHTAANKTIFDATGEVNPFVTIVILYFGTPTTYYRLSHHEFKFIVLGWMLKIDRGEARAHRQ